MCVGGGGGGCGEITRGTHWNQRSETKLTNIHIMGEITDPFGTQKPIIIYYIYLIIGKRHTTSVAAMMMVFLVILNAAFVNRKNVCSVA